MNSDALLSFIDYHIHAADDHYVRWKWTVGSVAMWDNRCAVHRVIPGEYEAGSRRGIRTTVFGEKRKLCFRPPLVSSDENLSEAADKP